MKTSNIAEIIAVGDEVLRGYTINTNGAYLAKYLFERAYNVRYQTNVGDNREDILAALTTAKKRASHIFLIGGLGPTEDDLTKEILAEFLDRMIFLDEKSLKTLNKYYKENNRVMTEVAKKQAQVIEDSIVLQNSVGIAPGEIVEDGNNFYYLLPGPPSEFHAIIDDFYDKYLINGVSFYTTSINVFLLGESPVEVRLRKLNINKNITVNTYAKGSFTEIDIISYDEDKKSFDDAVFKIEEEFKGYTFTEKSIEEHLVKKLLEKDLKISFMESMTGGRLASKITSVSGSSNIFKESYVTYSDESKVKLGVNKEIIDKYSVVSFETARSMAEALKKLTDADILVSVTGEAGPISSVKEVGLVYSTIIYKEKIIDLELHFGGSRSNIQNRTCESILSHVIMTIGGYDGY